MPGYVPPTEEMLAAIPAVDEVPRVDDNGGGGGGDGGGGSGGTTSAAAASSGGTSASRSGSAAAAGGAVSAAAALDAAVDTVPTTGVEHRWLAAGALLVAVGGELARRRLLRGRRGGEVS